VRKVTVGDFQTTPKMRELVGQVLDTGRISYGPMCREFEQRFAGLHDCRFGVLSNSGTSSLQVALQALKELHGWKDGDEVIVPSVTFVATPNIVLHNQMIPVLVDVEPDYYGIDPNVIEDAITPDTRAIIPVHLFGQPCDITSIMEIAKQHQLSVVEDSCEAMFVRQNNRPVGSFGDVGCFSMYVAHLLTAGVGGIAITENEALAVKMRSLVNHGRDGIYISIDDDEGLESNALKEVVSRRFNFESIGHSYRITELEAALALAQLDDPEGMLIHRRTNAAFLTLGLLHLENPGRKLRLPGTLPNTEHAYMMYPIVVNGDKWPLCNWLEENGVQTREMLRLTDQPVYMEMGLWNPDDYPVAAEINRGGFYVGVHPGLDVDDMDYVASLICEWFSKSQ